MGALSAELVRAAQIGAVLAPKFWAALPPSAPSSPSPFPPFSETGKIGT